MLGTQHNAHSPKYRTRNNVKSELHDSVVLPTLRRSEKRNSLNCNSLSQSSIHVSHNREQTHTVLLEEAVKTFQHGFLAETVVAREAETQALRAHITKYLLRSGDIAPVYVLGEPGSGKTSVVLSCMQEIERDTKLRPLLATTWSSSACVLNGAQLSSVDDFLDSLHLLVSGQKRGKAKNKRLNRWLSLEEGVEALQAILRREQKCFIAVLDEADHLASLPHMKRRCKEPRTTLETLLSLTSKPDSRLQIIAISNATRLGMSLRLRVPSLATVVFEAYTETQLVKIVNRRIELARSNAVKRLAGSDTGCSQFLTSQRGSAQNSRPAMRSPVGKCRQKDLMEALMSCELFDENTVQFTLKRLAYYRGDCRQVLEIFHDLLCVKLTKLSNLIPTEADSTRGNCNASRNGLKKQEKIGSPPGKRRQRELDTSEEEEGAVLLGSPGKRLRGGRREALDEASTASATSSSDSPNLTTTAVTDSSSIDSSSIDLSSSIDSPSIDLSSPERGTPDSDFTSSTAPPSMTSAISQRGTRSSLVHRERQRKVGTGTTVSTPPAYGEVEAVQKLNEKLGRITLDDAQEVMRPRFRQQRTKYFDILSRLPLHQQVLLYSICLVFEKKQGDAVDLAPEATGTMDAKIQAMYLHLCETYRLSVEYNSSDWKDGLMALQECGIVGE